MSASDRFVALLVTILTGVGIITTGVVWVLRMLWNIRGSWDATNAKLERLVDKVGDLVAGKREDHERLDKRDDRIEARMERHEQWHDEHPQPTT